MLDEGDAVHTKADALAVKENEAELTRLATLRDEQFHKAQLWRDSKVQELQTQLIQRVESLQQQAVQDKLRARTTLTQSLAATEHDFLKQLRDEELSHQSEKQRLSENTNHTCVNLQATIDELDRGGINRIRVSSRKAVQLLVWFSPCRLSLRLLL